MSGLVRALCLIFTLLLWPVIKPAGSATGPAPENTCMHGTGCKLDGRSYQVKVPPDWDKKSPLPVLMHFHGWGRTGKNVVNNPRITQATDKHGFLLVAPDGLGKSWDFWDKTSRDTPFAKAILADLKTKWPLDENRIYLSGFSYGSAMAWRLACESDQDFAGLLAIAGTLWQQEDIQCQGGPIKVTHVHGLKDNVMSLPKGKDNNPLKGIELWRRTNQCQIEPDTVEKINIFTCHHWTGCTSGKETSICLHNYGHMIPKGWLDIVLGKINKI
ncbi:alpha/beta hydrolase family esterase [Kiloniella litopenaei]|uniref:alpha/beta hydrolase family esterase n=1 Tax=Kiloniella litopenaei TaxID=1549748 RepID=UPI003BA9D7F5